MQNEVSKIREKNHRLAEIIVKNLEAIRKAEDQNDELISILENFDKEIEGLKTDLYQE